MSNIKENEGSKYIKHIYLNSNFGNTTKTHEEVIREVEEELGLPHIDLEPLTDIEFHAYLIKINILAKERDESITKFLNTRICDAVKGASNTQTYLEFIRESEDQFEMPHKVLTPYVIEEIKDYINFLDELWNK